MWLRIFATAFDWWTLFAASLGLSVGGAAMGNGVLSLLGHGPVPNWILPFIYLLSLLVTGILYYANLSFRLGAAPGKWLFHVVAGALRPGGRVEFVLPNGRVIHRYWVGGCSPHWELDLCVLQLDHKPTRWFVEKPDPVVVGD